VSFVRVPRNQLRAHALRGTCGPWQVDVAFAVCLSWLEIAALPAAPAPAAASAADFAPRLETHAIHAIPVALICCSPVIKPASLERRTGSLVQLGLQDPASARCGRAAFEPTEAPPVAPRET
jgi:hypothetical protein